MNKLTRLAALQAGNVRALLEANRAEFGGFTMVAGTTTSADVFSPEVWRDMAQAEFVGALRIAGSGAVLTDNTLVGQPGDTINFPAWKPLSDMTDLAETDVLVPEKMDKKASHATIKEAGKAVEITDRSKLVGLGDPEAEARRQFGILAARKVDADLITAAQADETSLGGGLPLTVTQAGGAGKTKLSYADYLVPAAAAFGDEWDPQLFSFLAINPAQYADLMLDPLYIDASKLGAGQSPLITGQIGTVVGVPVVMSSRIAVKKFILAKQNSLGLLYKRAPLVESDRDILARTTVVATTQHYAVKRLSDRGILVGTIAAS